MELPAQLAGPGQTDPLSFPSPTVCGSHHQQATRMEIASGEANKPSPPQKPLWGLPCGRAAAAPQNRTGSWGQTVSTGGLLNVIIGCH